MSEAAKSALFYVWFDTEYSTLELEEARLLQVAATVTDHRLQRVASATTDLNLVIRLDDEHPLSPWVSENLPNLASACRSDSAVPVATADAQLCDYLDHLVGPPMERIMDRPVLSGNSIHADWFLIRKFLPGFLDRLHYRFLDVTSIKLQWQDHFQGAPFDKEDSVMLRTHFPEAHLAEGAALHDAYYDIQASIAELAYYRSGLQKVDPAS